VYLNDKSFTIRTKEKKDGVDWIVDLKLTKKWKGKWEKKDGFCRVVDLNLQRNKRIWRVPKKKKKLSQHIDGIVWIVDLKLSKKSKGNKKKKMGFAELCIWNVRDLLRRRERKKRG